jgi:catechol 2,3-dioxygenase-like lactoylglutathione lyase family enzyme
MLPAFDTATTGRFLRDMFDMEPVEVKAADKINPADPEHLLLYVDDSDREIHVVKPVPDFSVRNSVPINPTMGHLALTVDDLSEVKRRLTAGGWTWGEGGVIGPVGRRRLYLYDPYMNIYEINERV